MTTPSGVRTPTTTTTTRPTTTDVSPRPRDTSSGRAIRTLTSKPGEISGDDMQKAIIDGTQDRDNQAAGREYADFKQFSSQNWDRMSPNAKEKYRVYEKYAEDAKSRGQTGIDDKSYKQMQAEMKTAGYKDETSGRAIEVLKDKPGTISGDDMQKCITDATKDLDGQAAGKEYKDLKKFYDDNQARMSPEAKEKFGVYDKYAKDAQSRGQTGIDTKSYDKMQAEMRTAGYKDQTSGKAIEDLKDKTKGGEISGADMQKTILDATKDRDNQAAGKEYQDLKKFTTENWDRMSPDAREKFRTYEGYAKDAQAKGQTGIDDASYKKMERDLNKSGYNDQSSGKAVEKLKDTKGEISGADMEKAIVDATKDRDNQAAGKEYKDLKKFATENWDRMSPDAREKFGVYEKYAKGAQAKGQTGIDEKSYNKMCDEMKTAGYKDAGSGKAIEELKDKTKGGPISGADMEKAIVDGTKDRDAQAAGKEYQDLKKFATENWDRMTPDAREKFRTYEKYANAAQAKGQTGIADADYNKMVGELRTAGYSDTSSAKAIEDLKAKKGTISGDDMQKAIVDATKDLDNNAAGGEYKDLKKFATENWDRMSPEAREKFRTYERYAESAQARGMTGIPTNEYDKMVREMKTAGYNDKSSGEAIERLKDKKGPITGDDLHRAIIEGTADKDNNAAAGEYRDYKKFVTENWDRLTPDAKEKWRVYERYAESAQARGMTGIPDREWQHMNHEMKCSGYLDHSAGHAIEDLRNKPGPITARDFIDAVYRGTSDRDGQAAGAEYADFYRFALQNWNRMTPDARAAFGVYTAHVQESWMMGQVGISDLNYHSMFHDMRAAADLLFLRQGFFRI